MTTLYLTTLGHCYCQQHRPDGHLLALTPPICALAQVAPTDFTCCTCKKA